MLYNITISGTGTDAAQGFIDPRSVYQLGNADPQDVPTTFNASLAKSRANHRFKSVIFAIQFYSGMNIVDTVVTGGNANTAPTAVTLVVDIDNLDSVRTPDEENAGQNINGENAVKRIVARALTQSWSRALEVLDPTQAVARGNSTMFARSGPRVVNETVGSIFASLTAAEAAITITT